MGAHYAKLPNEPGTVEGHYAPSTQTNLRKAVEKAPAEEGKVAAVTNKQDILDWWDLNAICLHHTIQYNQHNLTTAAGLWETLELKYGKQGMASIYLELKSAFDTPIPANSGPSLALEKITPHSGKLQEAGEVVSLSSHLQALIIMAKLPPAYDSLAQIMCQTDKITDLNLEKVIRAIGISWDQRNNGAG